jgi:hypothetical protein
VDHNKVNRGHGPSLVDRALMWPTPRASEGFRGTDPPHGTGGPSLRQAATTVVRGFQGSAWQQAAHSTLTASHHDPTTTTGGSDGKVLNPRFVEALMGLPNGWLMPSTSAATASYPSAPAKPGNNSPTDTGTDAA